MTIATVSAAVLLFFFVAARGSLLPPPDFRSIELDEAALSSEIHHTDRQSSSTSCTLSDTVCMSMVALNEVNKIRAGVGKAALSGGTMAMLQNALSHSSALADQERLRHQNLKETSLGCNAFFSGENLAQNNLINAGSPPNVARMCVKQLENSPNHYENIISDYHKYTVMGVYIDADDKVWCTQIFAVNVQFTSEGNCAPVGESEQQTTEVSSEETPSTSSLPSNDSSSDIASTGYAFKNKKLSARYKKRIVQLELMCSGACRYCFKDLGSQICLSEVQSINYDKMLSGN